MNVYMYVSYGRVDGWMEGLMGGWLDGWMDERMDGWIDG